MRTILPDVANDEFVAPDSHRRLSNLGLRPTERRNRSDVPHRRMAVVTPGIRRLMPGVTITFWAYYRWCASHTIGALMYARTPAVGARDTIRRQWRSEDDGRSLQLEGIMDDKAEL